MKRWLVLMYGGACYLMFLGVFLYALGFVGNFGVPTRLDSLPMPSEVNAPNAMAPAWAVNMLLLSLFALQHSVMARPWFKAILSRWMPETVERSTYVLASSLALGLLFWQWRPMGGVIWDWSSELGMMTMYGLFAAGWLTVLVTTFLIDHFDLFGLKQVWAYFRGTAYRPPTFRTPGPYKFVRHPMYIGWLLAFWATPTMTVPHFLFAVVVTVYIVVAIQFEERDLVHFLGPDYADYRRRVPMLIPRMLPRQRGQSLAMPQSIKTKGT